MTKHTDRQYLSGNENPSFSEAGGNPADPTCTDSNGVALAPYQNTSGSPNGTSGDFEVAGGEDLKCGYGRCTPGCMQRFNNPRAFLACLSTFCLIQGFVVNGVSNVNVSTIERRFELPSSTVGLVFSFYDIGAGLLVIPVSYFGATGHKPRWLSVAALSIALGSFIMIIPHLTDGPYSLGQTVINTCPNNATAPLCDDTTSLANYKYVFFLAQALLGFGGTCLYTLGIVYLDENVRVESSPLYLGIMYFFATLGPAIGYLLGGHFLDYYVDILTVDAEKLTVSTDDPNFVGAWWIGYGITSILGVVIAVIIFAFPSELPGSREAREGQQSQAHGGQETELTTQPGFGSSLSQMPGATKSLVRNPTFVFLTMAGVSHSMITGGVATFTPKFLQNQFNQSAAWAAMITGIIAVPGAAGAQLVGGLIARKMKLKLRGMLKGCVLASSLVAITTCVYLSRCESAHIAGIDRNYITRIARSRNLAVNMTSSCNAKCKCTTLSYEPLCGSDGLQYFSPCHAGCRTGFSRGEKKFYTDCSCIQASSPAMKQGEMGKCKSDCKMLYVFCVFCFPVVFFLFVAAPLSSSATLRCVQYSQRSFAIGLQALFIRFLGTVPAPILFGAIFDATCRLWQNKCDENGSCWIYDEERLSKDLFTLILVLSLLSASLYFLALVCYKKPRTETDASTCLVYSVGEDGGRTNRQTDLHTLHREPGIYLVGHDTPVVHPFHIETSI